MSTILEQLPIELWNIILIFSDSKSSKNFMYVCHLYKLFNKETLIEINKNYIYDYIVSPSLLNINIYKLFNTIEEINTKSKYITIYASLFENMCYLDRELINIDESLLLRNHLESKIKDVKLKQKFQHLTNKIIDYGCKSKNNNIKMIQCL